MIETIEQVFPKGITANIFKFCSDPCADMIKNSIYEFNDEVYGYCINFDNGYDDKRATRSVHLSEGIHCESYWNNLQHIIKCRKQHERILQKCEVEGRSQRHCQQYSRVNRYV